MATFERYQGLIDGTIQSAEKKAEAAEREEQRRAEPQDAELATYVETSIAEFLTHALKARASSAVVVEAELVGMRTQTHRVDFLLPLHADPGADHVAGEHVAAEQELMVGLEGCHRLLQ